MPINLQPAFEVLPAYRPIEFECYGVGLALVNTIENAVVTIYKGGVAIGPGIRYKPYRTQPSVFPNITEYYFKIDIQKYVQDSLAPFVDLPSSLFDASGTVINSDFYDEFYIEIDYEAIDLTDGLLKPAPFTITETSNTFRIFAASRTHLEPMNLEDYYGVILLQDTRWLTKSSRFKEICVDEQAFLSVIKPNSGPTMNGYEVRLFDSAGVLLSRGLAQTFSLPFATQFTINVSVDALSNETYIDGTPNFADLNLAYYTVTAGYYWFVSGSYLYVEQVLAFQYTIKPACCGLRNLRLHFVNLLGGIDSYTFNSEKDLQIKTTSDRSQKSLNWITGSTSPHSTSDVGFFKIKSEASQSYKLKSRLLTNTEALWLSELLSSPKVYAEIDGFSFVPVIVEDTDQSVSRQQGKIQFEITVTLSNDWIVQRV